MLINKILVIGITFLFLGASIAVANLKESSVIIVDDEGDGDYTSIKEALSHANPGDTIEVYSGTYYEVEIYIIEEGITLQGIPYELGNGNDIGKPFIDGRGIDDMIFVEAKNVIIDGFRIENNGGPKANTIIVLRQGSCTISNNDIAHTTMSCIWSSSSNNTILNNNISHSAMRYGICLCDPCSNCIVSGNAISDVTTGILCWDSNQNTISGNKIMRCSRFGIDVAGSYNKIIGNHLENNSIGIQIYEFFISVKRNNFINNEVHSQFIYGIPLLQRFTNIWFRNYWDRPRLLPYPIFGVLVLLPIIQFDWRPALKPYDI